MAISFHRNEQRLRRLLRLWAFIFTLVGLVQIFAPAYLVELLNGIGRSLAWPGPELPLPETRFYSSLGISLLAVLVVLCVTASNDLKRRLINVRILLLSKWVSTAAYLGALCFVSGSFAYFAGAVADGSIALITYQLYRRVRNSY